MSRLRAGPLHAALGQVPYWVGGETAESIDATQVMFDTLPQVGLALLVIVALMLLFALRSVFLPAKAVVLVVLSLGASLGSLLLLVTTRLGATLIGANGPQAIYPIVPGTIVAITVALSTDYEVILISRIAEHYRRTGDNRAAVVSGIEHTGSVITSAAAIMVAVFTGFALADLPALKQLGVGLAIAVFLDATLVRGMLVPAAMAVMGRGNWWWPRIARPQARPAPTRKTTAAVPVATISVPGQNQPPSPASEPAAAPAPVPVPSRAAPVHVRVPSGAAPAPVPVPSRAAPALSHAAPALSRAAFAREIAARVPISSVSVREEKQAIGGFDDHAGVVRGANVVAAEMLADHHDRYDRATGRIHDAADVKQTVVMERRSSLPAE